MSEELLQRAVEHYFAPGQRQRALAVLASYGEQPHDRDLARVRFDLVALSRGDLVDLERHAKQARVDHQGILERAERARDPITGEIPRVRLLRALGVEEGDPGAGTSDLGN
jgi:hypothetical protein